MHARLSARTMRACLHPVFLEVRRGPVSAFCRRLGFDVALISDQASEFVFQTEACNTDRGQLSCDVFRGGKGSEERKPD